MPTRKRTCASRSTWRWNLPAGGAFRFFCLSPRRQQAPLAGAYRFNRRVRKQCMRIGVFGGTFDPVHVAHLIIAEQCREQAGLDQVWFIPAARPPHKQDRTVTPFAHRVEMLGLAIAGNPAFRIDELEKDRPGSSFTVDTL